MATLYASKALVKDIRALRLKKHRDETRTFYAEGISVVLRALELGAPVQTVLYSTGLLSSDAANQAIQGASERGVPCYETDASLFASLSERDNPVGIAAVIAYQDRALDDLSVGPKSAFVVLDEIKSPGNLGTIIRTADGLGFDAVLLSGETTDQYHQECVKASMGTVFSMPIARCADLDGVMSWCKTRGISVISTSCRARDDITAIRTYPRPCMLLMGAEATGLEESAVGAGQLQVRIPMHGSASSLNLAIATAIIMYDIASKAHQLE